MGLEWAIFLVNILLLATAVLVILGLRKRILVLQLAQQQVSQMPLMNDANVQELLQGESPMFLSLQIHNCAELAADRSKLGGSLSALAPSAIRSVVYKQVAKQLSEQLDKQGVIADVEVHRAD